MNADTNTNRGCARDPDELEIDIDPTEERLTLPFIRTSTPITIAGVIADPEPPRRWSRVREVERTSFGHTVLRAHHARRRRIDPLLGAVALVLAVAFYFYVIWELVHASPRELWS